MATTGIAAEHLKSTSLSATTIHKALQSKATNDSSCPLYSGVRLNSDIIIIDEASMSDTQITEVLLRSIQNGSHLVLVGDADQLPSVEPGQVPQRYH